MFGNAVNGIPELGSEASSIPERVLYSVIETAALLSVSDRHVWRLIYEGKLPAKREGRRVLVHRDSIAEYANSMQDVAA
jgi:excisionase family DNA binding protein